MSFEQEERPVAICLGEFLRDRAARTAPWNCSTLAADWCMTRGHTDFAAAWRDITDPVDCETTARDGLVHLWDIGIGDALPVVTDLSPGDIGVVSLGSLEAGAIWTGSKWAIQTPRGTHFAANLAVIKAWRPQ